MACVHQEACPVAVGQYLKGKGGVQEGSQRADDEAELRTEAAELRLGYTPWLRALSLAWVADQLS